MRPLIKIPLLLLAVGIIWAFQVDPPSRPLLSEGSFVEPSTRASEKINVNEATARELELLPGIGPKLALAIIQVRDKHGGFQTLEQLKEVKGIGEKRFTAISGFLTLDEEREDSQRITNDE
jgi:competence protein ComEA